MATTQARRAFEGDEIKRIEATFTGSTKNRNRALFAFMILSGYRVSEVLSLKVGDVYDGKQVKNEVTVKSFNMKGGKKKDKQPEQPPRKKAKKAEKEPVEKKVEAAPDEKKVEEEKKDKLDLLYDLLTKKKEKKARKPADSRTVEISQELASYLQPICVDRDLSKPLFASEQNEDKAITPQRVWQIIKWGAKAAGIKDIRFLSCHSTRKTYAKKAYSEMGKDILMVKDCLGHRNLASTQHYLTPNSAKVKKIVKGFKLESMTETND